jgi:hypothetical protein
MAQIIDFPNADDRDWRVMEVMLREKYNDMLDGPATLEECLPDIHRHWQEIFASFSIQPSYKIPGPITQEQHSAINTAVKKGIDLVVERLKSERANHFATLVVCEFKAAYFRRNCSI